MLFSAAVLLALLPAGLTAPSAGPLDKRAPLIQARSPAKVVPGKYIVKLKDGITDAAVNKAVGKYTASQVYKGVFKGFAGTFDAASLEAIRNLPDVEYVEEDAVFTINGIVTQTNAPWNLARISRRTAPSTSYRYDSTAGSGTCSYIIDTGVDTAHPQFENRAFWGANFAGDGQNSDLNGHGTAAAGVVGAITYGVAKKTKIIAVKVLNASGSGSTSGVISGMNWVVTDKATRGCPNGTAANMAIGGGFSASVNAAARNMVNGGVFLSVSSGADNANAANYSPASEPLACTVAASTQADAAASFSNWGSLIDIYAPGQNILTTWIGGGTNTLSGTSMAAAHITGLGAYLHTLRGSLTTAAQMCPFIRSIATQNVLTGVPTGTSNLLAYNGVDCNLSVAAPTCPQ
ncbi:subtilisin-like serine protease precursor [Apodospora peruviana]|uniref:Subtilisin-like serine protease n=1 Tax=Apodospora peruviana TaxID=516989 RepID=A0AAE0HTZ7_9PEZI|nr:subtilisin-like serine protease precursor [Apodospora peruviana]